MTTSQSQLTGTDRKSGLSDFIEWAQRCGHYTVTDHFKSYQRYKEETHETTTRLRSTS